MESHITTTSTGEPNTSTGPQKGRNEGKEPKGKEPEKTGEGSRSRDQWVAKANQKKDEEYRKQKQKGSKNDRPNTRDGNKKWVPKQSRSKELLNVLQDQIAKNSVSDAPPPKKEEEKKVTPDRRAMEKQEKKDKWETEVNNLTKCAYEFRRSISPQDEKEREFLELIEEEQDLTFRRNALFFITLSVALLGAIGVCYFIYSWWMGGPYMYVFKAIWAVFKFIGFWTLPSVFLAYFVWRAVCVWNERGFLFPAIDCYWDNPPPYYLWVALRVYLMVVWYYDSWVYFPTYLVMLLAAVHFKYGFHLRRGVRVSVPLPYVVRVLHNPYNELTWRDRNLPYQCHWWWVDFNSRLTLDVWGGNNYELPEFVVTRFPTDIKTGAQYYLGCLLDICPFIEVKYYWHHRVTHTGPIKLGSLDNEDDNRRHNVQHLDLLAPTCRVDITIESQKGVYYRYGNHGWTHDYILANAMGKPEKRVIRPCLSLYFELPSAEIGSIDPSSQLFNERVDSLMRSTQTVNVSKYQALHTKIYEDTYYLTRMIWADNKARRLNQNFH